MKYKSLQLIWIIAAWAVLNAGAYAAGVLGFQLDATTANTAESIASVLLSVLMTVLLWRTRRSDPAFRELMAAPILIATLGILSWYPVSLGLIAAGALLASFIAGSFVENRIDLERKGAVFIALLGAMLPIWWWGSEEQMDGVDSLWFWMPVAAAGAVFAVAGVFAMNPFGYGPPDRDVKKFGAL